MIDEQTSLVVAFATLDGEALPKEHFGEAPQFEIYRVSATDATKLETVRNPLGSGEHGAGGHHHHHGDAGKGAGIGRLLAGYDVQVMVSRAFGPNIKRMRQRFVPVKVDSSDLSAAIGVVQGHWDGVLARWLEGPERKHLVLHD